ncbi:MAG: GntR family transcriptional regulator [Deltaproteobacteria bacterium]|nr:GntR family transcriptional regulator [Deltaproteobacteria bacterium]
MAKIEKAPKIPMGIQAYHLIHKKIITLDLEPGQHLDEKQLVHQLGIGRTPIREALLRLASEFLVETQPSKGFIVRPLTVQNVKAMFEAMHIMEMGVVSLAIRQDPSKYLPMMEESQKRFEKAIETNDVLEMVLSNHSFHMHFAQCSANEYLIRALKDVRNEVNRLSYLSFGSRMDITDDIRQHYKSVDQDHLQMMDCLIKKDQDLLQKTVEEHNKAFQRRVIFYLTSSKL